MDGDFKMFGLEPVRENNTRFGLFRQIHIEHGVTTIAIKVTMLEHIGAEPGGAAVELHLTHEESKQFRNWTKSHMQTGAQLQE